MENYKNLAPLIYKAKKGDEQAMTSLLNQFDRLLIKLSINYLGVFDEDCYQVLSERFIKAVRRFDSRKF